MNHRKLQIFVGMWMVCMAMMAQGKWKYDFIVPDNGNFVQAIHAANNRTNKQKRYRIFIRPSYYRIKGEGNMISTVENGKKVEFPSPMTTLTAPNTSIIGDSWPTTQIENCPQHEGISITSTLYLHGADSTYIQDVEFWSNYRNDPKAFANRAVALNEQNCKGNILKQVSLLSTQDTYYTNDGGTTYLEDCKISGTVDFICGGGTIYFNHCDLWLIPRGDTGSRDVITAPATEVGRKYGYVFADCYIDGGKEQDGRFQLGRPWKNSPKCVWLNCSMNVVPAKEGWTEMHGTIPSQFAEYNSTDGHFSLLDLSGRKTTFKNANGQDEQVDYKPFLTDEETEDYTVDKVFPGWKPQDKARQVDPPILHAKGKVITWEDIPEAGCYAICRDRKIIAFTTQPSYTIGSTYEGACYSVRCANWYGGLGPRSAEVVYPFR
ncbi:MAG: pectinesterase family protein [Bacteroidaceae bacterium]|nr:pectinesterase family protein [Bacteroidaceae bacterium]